MADIDRHVKYLALRDAHQHALRLRQLVMQAAQDVTGGLGMVVLHRIDIEAVASWKARRLKLSKKNPRC